MSENRECNTHMQALRQALADGERSGAPEALDFDAFIARKRARLGGGAAHCRGANARTVR